ncbi:MAG: pyruvate, phosphate dikinase [Deltaproteobacteria bacterium CG03_land_8_20_14_0_80_45_14]|nr:MAG: pyruvate, phosphate dikinase [Deltaproteobacteria bacterium CG03_land_8_20_14_0_80_45_14]
MKSPKYAYLFEEADGTNKKLLGGKGAGLAEMTHMGLPIPPGFIVTTEACLHYYENKKKLPKGFMEEVEVNLKTVEEKTGKKFGSSQNPLFFSVRSGAAISMPGMMDTILNLGLNDNTLEGLIKITSDGRFAYDAYRRFIQLSGKIALGVEEKEFDQILNKTKVRVGAKEDTDLDVDHLKDICKQYLILVKKRTGTLFPQDPMVQLKLAIEAVFKSWMGKRAVDYRKEFKITSEMANGTAVNVCTMVFGNMGFDSATGVAFTRDPGTGENILYGEYLVNAQGEDVVAGIRTPMPIQEMKKEMPKIYRELERVRKTLEEHFHEVQDFEFTVEKKTLYILQTRNGKMNAQAIVRTSKEMVAEKLITKEQAVLKLKPQELEQLLHNRIDPNFKAKPIAIGLPASPGAASGKAIFDADEAERVGKLGDKVILVREETKPEDIHGFFAARGILTSRGGKTSHAAVVARGMGKPCVSGCEELRIDPKGREAIIRNVHIKEGDFITIDGSRGEVYLGEVPTVDPEISKDLLTLLSWADEVRTMGVRANADTPDSAVKARQLGAEGIGLCRTERMFNAVDRLPIVREMILAGSKEKRAEAIDKLLPMQKKDFKEIFRAMEGFPVTVRLLDPPLHEFLPSAEELASKLRNIKEVETVLSSAENISEAMKFLDPVFRESLKPLEQLAANISEIKENKLDRKLIRKQEETLRKVKKMMEVNPMLGHRGVRLGITYPEIYRMQIQSVLEAAAELVKEGLDIQPEIMVPQVCTAQELKWVYQLVKKIQKEVEKGYGIQLQFKFGTMIEVVRACMRAGRLAEVADFFSFGTNDLTQATFSFSREDAENKFLPLYNERKILQDNPFEVLDVKGVGRLMMITIEWGRKTKPDLKIGICGEHGGHPESVEFCHTIGLSYVSCSVPRLPIARLAAAHAKLKEKDKKPPEKYDPDTSFSIFF